MITETQDIVLTVVAAEDRAGPYQRITQCTSLQGAYMAGFMAAEEGRTSGLAEWLLAISDEQLYIFNNDKDQWEIAEWPNAFSIINEFSPRRH